MNSKVEMGTNRTGIALSPIDKKLLIGGTEQTIPSSPADPAAIPDARAEYVERAETIGSMPPPASLKGAAGAVVDMVKGANANVLLDKIGERLAFERTGTRLYAALLDKFDASAPLPGGPSRGDLEKIHGEELAHFMMLREAILSLGGDPTAVTPSADVAAVASMGLLQVIGDPRMNLKQSLEAILVAELVDNDCWLTLTELAVAAGHEELARRFEQASAEEAEHLVMVRSWVKASTLSA